LDLQEETVTGSFSIVQFSGVASFFIALVKLFGDNPTRLIKNGYKNVNSLLTFYEPLRPINTIDSLIKCSKRTAVVERKAKSSTSLRKRLSLGRTARNSSVTGS